MCPIIVLNKGDVSQTYMVRGFGFVFWLVLGQAKEGNLTKLRRREKRGVSEERRGEEKRERKG